MNKTLMTLLVPFLVGAGLLLLLERLVRAHPTERNYEAFTEMVYSKAAESLSPSASLPGRMTQQHVLPGVVVRGQRPFHYGEGTEEAQRAGRELANPYVEDDSVLGRGAEIYGRFCVVCHGADGGGQGPVTRRGMLPPPSLLGARARALPDGELFHILTLGQGNMASYAAQVQAADRWKVIRHIRSLQEPTR